MNLVQTVTEIEYPESDGLPMGETDLHRKWMIRVFDLLSHRFEGRRVYVASNLLVYYEQGEPSRYVVPDDFVVLDCDPGDRRVFKIWEEGKSPDVVFEITSRSTRNEDISHKPGLYARMGVAEYFLFDPTQDYLSPPLQGFRLHAGAYTPIEADGRGVLVCEQLEVTLRLADERLVMCDGRTGEVLLTESEAERAKAEVERERAQTERNRAERERARADTERAKLKAVESNVREALARAQEAEDRAAREIQARHAAEEELRRLREQLKRPPEDAGS